MFTAVLSICTVVLGCKVSGTVYESKACFSSFPNVYCTEHRLTCSDTERISLLSVQYMALHNGSYEVANCKQCSVSGGIDINITPKSAISTAYSRCSGESSCTLKFRPTIISARYSKIRYTCISKTKTVAFCSNRNMTGNNLSMIYRANEHGTPNNKNNVNCKCQAFSVYCGDTVSLSFIYVRLYQANTTNCVTKPEKTVLRLPNGTVIYCDETRNYVTDFPYGFQPIINSPDIPSVEIIDLRKNSPIESVWIDVQSTYGDVTVFCGYQNNIEIPKCINSIPTSKHTTLTNYPGVTRTYRSSSTDSVMDSGGLQTGAVVGVTITVLVVLIILGILSIIFILKRRKHRTKSQERKEAEHHVYDPLDERKELSNGKCVFSVSDYEFASPEVTRGNGDNDPNYNTITNTCSNKDNSNEYAHLDSGKSVVRTNTASDDEYSHLRSDPNTEQDRNVDGDAGDYSHIGATGDEKSNTEASVNGMVPSEYSHIGLQNQSVSSGTSKQDGNHYDVFDQSKTTPEANQPMHKSIPR